MRRVAFAIVLAAGCGSKHAPKTYQVEIKGMQFVPAQLTVDVGDTITWTNEDVLAHTVTAGVPSPSTFDSKEIASKAMWSMTMTAAGDYNYVCTFHPTMHGAILVR